MSTTQGKPSPSKQTSREGRETLRRVAREQASWTSAVRRLIRPAPTPSDPTAIPPEAEEVSPLIPPELWAQVDKPHPFDLPWKEIDGLLESVPSVRVVQAESYATSELPWAFQEGLGLNGLKSFALEDDGLVSFGSGSDQFADAATLGVDRVRQYGPRELYWGTLTDGPREVEDDIEYRASVAVPVDEGDIEDLVRKGRSIHNIELPTNVHRMAELMLTAWRNGIKLRFTFLTLGGGNVRLLDANDELGVDTMISWPEWKFLSKGIGDWPIGATLLGPSWHAILPKSPLRMYWAPDHLDPSVLESAESDPLVKGMAGYALSSLDFGFSFQRAAARTIARTCATLLVEAEAAAEASLAEGERELFRLEDILDGIELFNECELRTIVEAMNADGLTVARADQTAQRWGRGFVMAALGFVEQFRFLKGADWPLPTLYLPGLSSYTSGDFPRALMGFSFPSVESGAARSWTWRHVFLDELCRTITRTWALLRGDLTYLGVHVSTPMPDLPELSSLNGGVDLHWYHFNPHTPSSEDGANLGILHAGWLVTEITAAADVLETHGLPGRVTVFESSASSNLSLGYQVAPGKGDDDDITEQEALEFQANDVWRRLLSAAAGGAERPSHHPWSEAAPTWLGCGLRQPASPPQNITARPAWFAFHRAGLLLRDSGEVRLVVPDSVPGRTTLEATEVSPNEDWVDHPVLMFEISHLGIDRIGSLDLAELRHAYVLMVDPTATLKKPGALYEVEIIASFGGLGLVQQMEPWAAEPAAWEIASSDPSRLPQYLASESIVFSSPSFDSSSGPVVIEMLRGDPVVILLAPEPLVFRVIP